jgi:hypothetical protein
MKGVRGATTRGETFHKTPQRRRYQAPTLDGDERGTTRSASAAEERWGTTSLTYAWVNYSPNLPVEQERNAVRNALATWSAVTPLAFSEVAPQSHPNITFRFGPIDGRNNVLAQTWYPPAGSVEFDSAESWSISGGPGGVQPIDLQTVALHEIGHALDLHHITNDPNSVMYPTYTGNKRALDANDIAAIQQLYGAHPVPPTAQPTPRSPTPVDRAGITSYDRMQPGALYHAAGDWSYAWQDFTAASNTITYIGVTVGNTSLPAGGPVNATVRIRLCTDIACNTPLADGTAQVVNFGNSVINVNAAVTPGAKYFVRYDEPPPVNSTWWTLYWWRGGWDWRNSDQMQVIVRGYNR